MSIPFTQYLRPHGTTTQVTIDRPPPIETMAKDIINKGCRFECEILRDGNVSFTVAGPTEKDGDIAIKLCRRDSLYVPSTVDLLVREAHVKVVGNRDSGRRRERERILGRTR